MIVGHKSEDLRQWGGKTIAPVPVLVKFPAAYNLLVALSTTNAITSLLKPSPTADHDVPSNRAMLRMG